MTDIVNHVLTLVSNNVREFIISITDDLHMNTVPTSDSILIFNCSTDTRKTSTDVKFLLGPVQIFFGWKFDKIVSTSKSNVVPM